MRRSSQRAIEIGWIVGVSPRRIEAWTVSKLDPIKSTSADQEIAHYQELAKLTGPGRGHDADSTALRMASKGHACRRLRHALARRMYIDQTEDFYKAIDISTDTSTDDAFWKFDEMADLLRSSDDGLPPLIRQMFGVLRANLSTNGSSRETADDVFHSAVVNLIYVLFGGEIYNPNAISTVFGFGGSEVDLDVVDVLNDDFHISVTDIDNAYRTLL